jgi:acyl-CoA synthetase (AMP-forming)/AMP-acid ligase II
MAESALIPDLLRERVAVERDRIAIIVDGGGAMSYVRWEQRSNAVARGLVARGVSAGDRIGLYFENSDWLDYAVAYMATLKAGAIAVPLSSRFSKGEAESIMERCGAVGAVGGPAFSAGAGRSVCGVESVSVAELETGKSTEAFRVVASPDDVAEILYTSGTTGIPQGVACRHVHVVRPLHHSGGWPPEWWSCDGIYLHANAISTAGGQLRLLQSLGPHRMMTLAMPIFDPARFCELVEQRRVTVAQLVPSMANSVLESGAFHGHDLSKVRVISFGCAPLSPALLPKVASVFPGAKLVNMYELTEARYAGTAFIYGYSNGHPRTGSVGLPRGSTQLRITDDEGRDVAAGVVGEIRLRWAGLPPQHYYGDAQGTARVFADGWTRTGDSGYVDGDGYLYLMDRLKDVIIKGGINISSLEIENALREHPAISDCAVVGVPDPLHGEEVAAALVVRQRVSVYELRQFLSARLAPHKIPQRYVELAVLPRNRSGKVVKRELQDLIAAQAQPPRGTPPAGHHDSRTDPPADAGARRLSADGGGGGRGLPNDNSGYPPLPDHLAPILEQLAQGATDVAASRRLKVSPRTFSRRVAELLDHLHVQTRFQCGAETMLRGLIPPDDSQPR